MASVSSREAVKWEKRFRALKELESKRALNDFEKNQLAHARNMLREVPATFKKEQLKIGKDRLALATDIESDRELLASLKNRKGITSMNELQLRAQEKSIQQRLDANLVKWNAIDFNDNKAKFNNQGDQFRFSSPEGRYVFKNNADQLRFDSNMAKAGIATLPNWNTGAGTNVKRPGDNFETVSMNIEEHSADGVVENKNTGATVDKTQITNTPKDQAVNDLKIQKGIYGMSIREWQRANKHERKLAKRLSLGKGGVNAPIRE